MKWSESNGLYQGHVIGHPKVRFQATSWLDLCESAAEAIDTHLQAGEYEIDWTPTPPLQGRGWRVHPDFVSLYGVDGVYLPTNDYSELYENGRCDHCHSLGYPRTSTPMDIEIESLGSICSGRNLWSPRAAMNHVPLLRKEFAEHISNHLPKDTQWRPTNRVGRGRVQFLEPIPANPVHTVGVTTREAGGWRCPDCGNTHFGQNDFGYTVGECIPESSIPLDARAFWIRRSLGMLELCVHTTVWEALNESKSVSGVTSGTVAIVEDQYIDHDIEKRLRVYRKNEPMAKKKTTKSTSGLFGG